MNKYLIGYKQANDVYVFVNDIYYSNISVTTTLEEAIDFTSAIHAQSVCAYLNLTESKFKVFNVTVKIEEVEKDVTTGK